MKEISLGLLMAKFRQCLTLLSARDTIMAGYYSLTFLFFQGKGEREALLMSTHNICFCEEMRKI